ncbi:hypothetical protein ANO11243_055820 [Dothideomycetidae sp. 11243]|nr:hypothetical protein ANO11243_055820 [fungal sp. No.11243]
MNESLNGCGQKMRPAYFDPLFLVYESTQRTKAMVESRTRSAIRGWPRDTAACGPTAAIIARAARLARALRWPRFLGRSCMFLVDLDDDGGRSSDRSPHVRNHAAPTFVIGNILALAKHPESGSRTAVIQRRHVCPPSTSVVLVPGPVGPNHSAKTCGSATDLILWIDRSSRIVLLFSGYAFLATHIEDEEHADHLVRGNGGRVSLHHLGCRTARPCAPRQPHGLLVG